ncbi:MAG: chemotaxis protein CheW [Anaeromyxobacteraceae bacterium]
MAERPRSGGEIDFAALERRLLEAERALGDEADAEVRRRVLEARAAAVAAAREAPRVESVPVLAFRVGGERYAVDVAEVFQVIEARGLSPLPGCPAWLLGAIVARTRVVPVLDLRLVLGLEGGGMTDLSKVVVVEQGGEAFGLAAEELEGRVEVPVEGLAPAATGPFRWVAPDRLALLDLEKVGAQGRG